MGSRTASALDRLNPGDASLSSAAWEPGSARSRRRYARLFGSASIGARSDLAFLACVGQPWTPKGGEGGDGGMDSPQRVRSTTTRASQAALPRFTVDITTRHQKLDGMRCRRGLVSRSHRSARRPICL